LSKSIGDTKLSDRILLESRSRKWLFVYFSKRCYSLYFNQLL